MIKRFLTYIKTSQLGVGLLLTMFMVSCDLEPSKEETRLEIEKFVFPNCKIDEWVELQRQGSFQSDDQKVRHRIYRCYVHIDLDQTCSVPTEIRDGKIVEHKKFLQLIPGKHELVVFLDYIEDAEDWQIQTIMVSDNIELLH